MNALKLIIHFSLILIAISIPCSYFYMRYQVNPIGMWDSWAMWNLKAVHLYHDMLDGNPLDLAKEMFPHKDYPFLIPIFTAFLMLIFQTDNQILIWLLHFSIYLSIFFILMPKPSMAIHSNKFYFVGEWGIFFLFILNPYFLSLATDLCADLPLALAILVSIKLFTYFEINKIKPYIYGISVGLPLWIKNEGLLISAGLCVMNLFLYRKTGRIRTQFLFLFPIILFLFILILYRLNWASSTNEDFSYSLSALFDLQSLIPKIGLVFSQFVKFHFNDYLGFFILGFIFIFLRSKDATLLAGGFVFTLFLVYNGIYLFSQANLEWHLDTSYGRIHNTLFPVFILLLQNTLRLYLKEPIERKENVP